MAGSFIGKIDAKALKDRAPDALAAMRKAATETGFAIIHNTAFSSDEVVNALEAYRSFFKLPRTTKDAFNMARTGSNRGWGAPQSEQVNPDANADYKEFFDCGFTLPANDPLSEKLCYSPNIWPDQPAEFQKTIQDYYNKALGVSHDILSGVAISLDKPAAHFNDAFEKPMALLRGNFYPERPKAATSKDFGIAAHTDYGCLTLLATDGSPGLEVQNRDGQWIPIQAPPGAFIINFGEMMTFWTDGLVQATLHRVQGTPHERLSIPMFFNPSEDTNVAPDGPHPCAPIMAGDYLQRRYEETYLHLKK
jgi:isopenicillin N synthase-like dioxygenase